MQQPNNYIINNDFESLQNDDIEAQINLYCKESDLLDACVQVENKYKEALRQTINSVRKEGQSSESLYLQAMYVKKIADIWLYLAGKRTSRKYYDNHVKAAKLYNTCLAILNNIPSKEFIFEGKKIIKKNIVDLFVAKMTETESSYLKALKQDNIDGINITVTKTGENIADYKDKLDKMNDSIEVKIAEINKLQTFSDEAIEKTFTLFQEMTAKIKSLLREMIKESINLLGEPKSGCQYTFIGLGSMGREEMTRYSDLEFAVLLNDNKYKGYFSKLVKLLQLKVINLGETRLDKNMLKDLGFINDEDLQASNDMSDEREKTDTEYRILEKNPCKKGLSFDEGGVTPTRQKELIGMPDTVINFLSNSKRWGKDLRLLANMCTAISIYDNENNIEADKKLFNLYTKKISEFLQLAGTNDIPSTSSKIVEKLKLDLKVFEPIHTGNTQFAESYFFLAKQELYRLPDRILDNLALLLQLKSNNVLLRIEQLRSNRSMEYDAANNLRKAVAFMMLLRLKAYMFYKMQKEHVYSPYNELNIPEENKERKIISSFYLTEEQFSDLRHAYTITAELHRNTWLWLNDNLAPRKNPFLTKDLLGESFDKQGKELREKYQFAAAKNNYLRARLFHANNTYKISANLAQLYTLLENYNEALKYLSECIDDSDLSIKAKHYYDIGKIYLELHDYDKAESAFRNAWKNSIATKMGKQPKELVFKDEVLPYSEGKLSVELITYLIGLSETCKFEKKEVAINYGKMALESYCQLAPNDRDSIYKAFAMLRADQNAILTISYDDKLLEKVLEFYQEMLKTIDLIGQHLIIKPLRAKMLNNIGVAYFFLFKFDKGLSNLEEAHELFESIQNSNRDGFDMCEVMALCLFNLGSLKQAFGFIEEAEDYYNQAKVTLCKISEIHPSLISVYSKLVILHTNKITKRSSVDQIDEYQRNCLNIITKVYGNDSDRCKPYLDSWCSSFVQNNINLNKLFEEYNRLEIKMDPKLTEIGNPLAGIRNISELEEGKAQAIELLTAHIERESNQKIKMVKIKERGRLYRELSYKQKANEDYKEALKLERNINWSDSDGYTNNKVNDLFNYLRNKRGIYLIDILPNNAEQNKSILKNVSINKVIGAINFEQMRWTIFYVKRSQDKKTLSKVFYFDPLVGVLRDEVRAILESVNLYSPHVEIIRLSPLPIKERGNYSLWVIENIESLWEKDQPASKSVAVSIIRQKHKEILENKHVQASNVVQQQGIPLNTNPANNRNSFFAWNFWMDDEENNDPKVVPFFGH